MTSLGFPLIQGHCTLINLSINCTHRPLVHVDLPLREVPHLLERVDGDEDGADVREDPVVHEALLQVVNNGGFLREKRDTEHIEVSRMILEKNTY